MKRNTSMLTRSITRLSFLVKSIDSIFLIVILLPSVVLSQSATSPNPSAAVTVSSSDDNQTLSTANTTPPSLPSPTLTIKFVELVAFHEHNHEAEFILQVVLAGATQDNGNAPKLKSSLENIFLNARSLQMISSRPQQQINGSHSNSVQVKLKVTIGCDMHYILYPFDSHLCSMALLGGISPPVFCKELKAYEFHVKGYVAVPLLPPAAAGKSKKPQRENQMKITKKSGGGAPMVNVIHMIMSRTSAMQIFSQMYSPVITLVMISFLTMLDATSLPIRIATSLSMLLCSFVITTLFWRDIPRAGSGDTTVLEYYFAIGVGFLFQTFFTNILLHWYTSLATSNCSPPTPSSAPPSKNINNLLGNDATLKNGDIEANSRNMSATAAESSKAEETLSDAESVEAYIRTLGKFHRYMFFKILKPAKKQLPIAFLIINVIYWVLVLYVSGGLPNGFQYLPSVTPESAALCL